MDDEIVYCITHYDSCWENVILYIFKNEKKRDKLFNKLKIDPQYGKCSHKLDDDKINEDKVI